MTSNGSGGQLQLYSWKSLNRNASLLISAKEIQYIMHTSLFLIKAFTQKLISSAQIIVNLVVFS